MDVFDTILGYLYDKKWIYGALKCNSTTLNVPNIYQVLGLYNYNLVNIHNYCCNCKHS